MSNACSFCGKPQEKVARMVLGPNVNICSECIAICYDLVYKENTPPANVASPTVQNNQSNVVDEFDIDFI